jgi:hypothetical protein
MKTFAMKTQLTLFLALIVFVSNLALADETDTSTNHHKTHKTVLTQASDPVSNTSTSDMFAPDYSATSSKYGLGFATSSRITGNSTALTGLINLSPLSMIQPLFSLSQTSGALQMTLGGIYKYTVLKRGSSGVHIGGSLGLGWLANGGANDFGFNLGALGGFHFPLPGTSEAIMLHFDGGAVFSHVGGHDGGPSTNNFAIDSVSPALGLTVLYML